MSAILSTPLYCKVQKCRFPHSHVTAGHKCGTCGQYGHGIIEHGNTSSYKKLEYFFSDKMPKYLTCTRAKCTNPTLHMTSGHMCELCNENTHSEVNCKRNNEFVCRKEQELQTKTKKHKIIKLDCQICSVENYVDTVNDVVFGVDTLCKICCDNNVELRLPVCKHTVMCISCAIAIGTKENQFDNNFFNNKFNEAQIIDDPILPEDDDVEKRIYAKFLEKCAGHDGKIAISIPAGTRYTLYAKRDGIGELPEFKFFDNDDCFNINMIDSNQEFVSGYKFIH